MFPRVFLSGVEGKRRRLLQCRQVLAGKQVFRNKLNTLANNNDNTIVSENFKTNISGEKV